MICLYRVSTEPQKGLPRVLVVKKHLLKTTKRHLHQDLSSPKSKITVIYNDKK